MGENKQFNKLASELSVEERNDLLKKLAGQSTLSHEPLYDDEVESSIKTIESQYQILPWYEHLLLLILSFFKSKSALKVYEDRLISKIGQEIETKCPGYFNYQSLMLLPPFYKALTDLKVNVRFFKDALDTGLNKDRGAFYAFLGSLEMSAVHKRLEEEITPSGLFSKHPEKNESELKQIAMGLMEDAFAAINEEERNAMYQHARMLSCLKELSFFLFDRILYAFANDLAAGGMTCSVSVVRDQLATLNNILYSLKTSPSISLLESLFVFILQEQAGTGKENIDIQNESKTLLSSAENSLTAIREFNQTVLLTPMLRVANRNMAFSPSVISGGEDWIIVYRDYWKQHIEQLFDDYTRAKQQQETLDSFRYFLKGAPFKTMEYAQSETNPDGIPIRRGFTLAFLLTFHSIVFIADVNKTLRPILLEGEFFKRENRTLFTESYNDLMKLDDDIKRFDEEISSNGEFGKQYAIAMADMSLTNRRRKIQIVVESANETAVEIVNGAKKALENMLIVLQGIAKKDPDDKNEMLSNIYKFTGKPLATTLLNASGTTPPVMSPVFTPKGIAFFNGINDATQNLRQALHILDNIETLNVTS
ncbi:MAG: DUF5312 domain-containing protein [Treponema sp.]|jgi:hypothetical protein|nr:DUF5312 domain-containing protein [Treponema sp.]